VTLAGSATAGHEVTLAGSATAGDEVTPGLAGSA
jgi:hypothetical protein